MKVSYRKLSDNKGESLIYALIITFMAIFVYSCVFPAFKAILGAVVPGMGEAEATIILIIPFAIFIAVLWGIAYVIHPKAQ